MRSVLFVSALCLAAAPALAQEEEVAAEDAAAVEAPEVRRCVAPQSVVPPFNNTPEAMEQSRIAATIVAGDSVCKSSPLMPELSEIQHGAEEAVVPGDEGEEEAEPA